MIHVTLPIVPLAKQSCRFTRQGRRYTPSDVARNARQMAAMIAASCNSTWPLDGPLRVEIVVTWPWHKSDSKRARAGGSVPHDTKPDWDNLGKQVCDVLQAAGAIENDSRICEATVRKLRGDDGPETQITVEELT